MKKVLNVCQSVSPAFFPFFNCADPDPNSEYRSQSTASLLQISNWFIPGHCCIKVTLHMFCYLRILFWPYWQDESGPQMCGSLFPFREDIFWQRQQWLIVITLNTRWLGVLSQWGLFPLECHLCRERGPEAIQPEICCIKNCMLRNNKTQK